MHGRPIPIPTLDEFILLHKVLRAALRLQPDMLDMIEGARRAFGWNVLGARAAWLLAVCWGGWDFNCCG